MNNLRELLERSAESYGSSKAFTLKTDRETYRDISFIRYLEEVRSLAAAFIRRGLTEGRIAIIGKNSYNWFLVNAAAQIGGGFSILLDKELKEDELISNLARSGATAIFYDQKEKARVDAALASGETIVTEAFPLYVCDGVTDTDDLLNEGKELIGSGDESVGQVVLDPERTSTFLFTSGTTSLSKIVMLSQSNLVANIEGLMQIEDIHCGDTNIALLPYHHAFGSTGQWYMLACGARTVFCDGLKYLQKNLKEYGVSVFVGVPLIVESIYKKILRTVEKEGLLGRLNRASKAVRLLSKVKIDLRRTIFKSVLDQLGGEMREVVLGASAPDPVCIQGFNDFGISCIQGYGLTETSPVLAAERPGVQRTGSVGLPMPDVEIRIFEPDEKGIGELIAKGPNIMQGYYQNEEATNEVLVDGWFHTGDLGYIDKDGFIFLTGRKKNVIVLKNGENVSPEEIETKIASLPYQMENIVVGLPNNGDERDLTVTLKLVYNPDYFVISDSYGSHEMPKEEIEAQIRADIEKINDTFPAAKRIRRMYITDEPMIKTSTGKVRRFLEIEKILEEEQAKAEAAEASEA
ncbi:MAG: AMP-binding protein [Mogibacterium sp.]|nr:AMP-binding protein [Mogibacterium sp.]